MKRIQIWVAVISLSNALWAGTLIVLGNWWMQMLLPGFKKAGSPDEFAGGYLLLSGGLIAIGIGVAYAVAAGLAPLAYWISRRRPRFLPFAKALWVIFTLTGLLGWILLGTSSLHQAISVTPRTLKGLQRH